MVDRSSQKYWDEDIDIEHSDAEEDMFTKEECEEIFKAECRIWLEQNASQLIGSPFANAYKKPWVRKKNTTWSEEAAFTPKSSSKKKQE